VCRYADFGDKRLKARLVSIMDALVTHPHASLPEALGTPQQLTAYYDFIKNPRVTTEKLVQVAQNDTTGRLLPEMTLLALHDTCEYNYSTHQRTTGLGPLSNPAATGLHVHSVLAVTAEGIPFGLLAQECWTRDPATVGIRHQRKTRAYTDKESARWTRGLDVVHEQVPSTVSVINIADREADIYAVFAADCPAHSALLIRVQHDRRATAADPTIRYLREAVADAPEVGGQYVEIPALAGQPARVAKVRLHVTTVEIHRPRDAPASIGAATTRLTLVWAIEVHPPAGVTPVEWLLATTLAVPDLATAWQVVYWYSLRWLIERYHYVLKSGLGQEDCQLRTADGLQKALTLYALVALRLLWLTYAARLTPEAPCTVALTPREWRTLHIATQQTPVPATPPPLAEAVHQLAMLGGHRQWPSAGPPGVKVLWRGWRTLQTMVTYAERLETYPGAP
jgi:hypothetical protein